MFYNRKLVQEVNKYNYIIWSKGYSFFFFFFFAFSAHTLLLKTYTEVQRSNSHNSSFPRGSYFFPAPPNMRRLRSCLLGCFKYSVKFFQHHLVHPWHQWHNRTYTETRQPCAWRAGNRLSHRLFEYSWSSSLQRWVDLRLVLRLILLFKG